MKAIQIKRDGKLWKLAEGGGMRQDGLVFSGSAEKFNKLLHQRYSTSNMSYDEYVAQVRQLYNPIDFCAFARRVLWGVIKIVAGVGVATAVLIAMAAPLISLIWWAIVGAPGSFRASGVLPFIGALECFASTIFACVLGYREWLKRQPKKMKVVKVKAEPTVADLDAKLNRIAVRRAFFDALKGKTCTKVEFTE